MRKLLLSALVMSSALLEGIEPNSERSNPSAQQCDVQMAKDPFKKLKKKQEEQNKKNPPQNTTVVGLSTFVSAVVNLTESQQSVNFNEPILFNSTFSQGGSIGNNEETGVLTASAPGIYEVSYGVKWTSLNSPSYVALRINGAVVTESRISASQNLNTVTLIVDASANKTTTFELINDSFIPPSSPITLVGDGAGNVSTAFITIKKIN